MSVNSIIIITYFYSTQIIIESTGMRGNIGKKTFFSPLSELSFQRFQEKPADGARYCNIIPSVAAVSSSIQTFKADMPQEQGGKGASGGVSGPVPRRH